MQILNQIQHILLRVMKFHICILLIVSMLFVWIVYNMTV